jgi:hypothetical protein
MPPVDLSVEETQQLTALLADLQGEAEQVLSALFPADLIAPSLSQ